MARLSKTLAVSLHVSEASGLAEPCKKFNNRKNEF